MLGRIQADRSFFARSCILTKQSIPDTSQAIVSPNGKLWAGGREGGSAHGKAGILIVRVYFLNAFGVPHAHNTAMRRRSDRLTINCPSDVLNRCSVAGKGPLRMIVSGIPHNSSHVQCTRYHLLLVMRGPGEPGHGRNMVLACSSQNSACERIKKSHFVGRPRYQSITFRRPGKSAHRSRVEHSLPNHTMNIPY